MAFAFHIIDFEGSRSSGVIEYGIVSVAEGQIVSTKTRLCGPEGAIHWRERETHGLTDAELVGLAPFREDWPLFSALRTEGPFGAHNAMVEANLLTALWPYPGLAMDFSEDPPVRRPGWGPWLDTLQLYRCLYPDLESYGLAKLVAAFGLKPALAQAAEAHCPPGRAAYHCALYDALASALLFNRLQTLPELQGVSGAWWLRQSAPSADSRQQMDQGELRL